MDDRDAKEAFYRCSSENRENTCAFVIKPDVIQKCVEKRLAQFEHQLDYGRVVGLIDTSTNGSASAGILVCDSKAYFFGFLRQPKKVWYDEISKIVLVKSNGKFVDLKFILEDESEYMWGCDKVDIRSLVSLFCELKSHTSHMLSCYEKINMEAYKHETAIEEAGGLNAGGRGEINKIFDEERFHARQGHGFAAERANNLEDRLQGKRARIEGDNNVKNGPDRSILNADGSTTWIQSKYCASGKASVNACFEGNGSGEFRYFDSANKPMIIEVASDKYEDAVSAMADKIRNGQVKGVTDPGEARNIVKPGNFTYEQAKNIARAGNVDSLVYDIKSGAVISLSALGVSAAISLAVSLWSGDEPKVALKNAAYSGIRVGGTTLIVSVLSSQIAKSSISTALNPSFQMLAKAMGPKAYAVLANAFRSGTNISGAAAANSAAKLLKGNAITAIVTTAVLTMFDVKDIARGRISGPQMARNFIKNTTTVAGGSAGWVGGAAIGSLVMPGVGTVIGGLFGSIIAGGGLGVLVDKATGHFIDSDAERMMELIQDAFLDICEAYLLNKDEAEKVSDALSAKISDKALKSMHASKEQSEYARKLIEPLALNIVKKRPHIEMPNEQLLEDSVDEALVDILEGMEDGEL